MTSSQIAVLVVGGLLIIAGYILSFLVTRSIFRKLVPDVPIWLRGGIKGLRFVCFFYFPFLSIDDDGNDLLEKSRRPGPFSPIFIGFSHNVSLGIFCEFISKASSCISDAGYFCHVFYILHSGDIDRIA